MMSKPVRIKDFKPGDPVFILAVARLNLPSVIKTGTVVAVGRKYLKVMEDATKWEQQFLEPENGVTDHLVQKQDWGSAPLLFPTREAAEEHLETNDLRIEIQKSLSDYRKLKELSLEQLRGIRDILKEDV